MPYLKENSGGGCPKLRSLQLTGCPKISVEALSEVLLRLPDLRYVGCDRLEEIFKSSRMIEAGKTFQVENFEFIVSSNRTETQEEKEAERHYVEKLSSVCPRLRRVKLNINNECLGKYFQELLIISCRKLTTLCSTSRASHT